MFRPQRNRKEVKNSTTGSPIDPDPRSGDVGDKRVEGVDKKHDKEEDGQVDDGFEVEIGGNTQVAYFLKTVLAHTELLLLQQKPAALANPIELLLFVPVLSIFKCTCELILWYLYSLSTSSTPSLLACRWVSACWVEGYDM